jgi:hypothetical protein
VDILVHLGVAGDAEVVGVAEAPQVDVHGLVSGGLDGEAEGARPLVGLGVRPRGVRRGAGGAAGAS